MEQIINELLAEIKYELFHYPETTKKQDIKYIIKRLLKPGNTPKRDSFFWTHAMLTQALERAEDIETLKRYYDAWIKKEFTIYNLDNIMNGYSLLYVYEKTGNQKYKQAADQLYKWVLDYAAEMGNSMPYRKHHPTHVYVDGLGMIVPFLCRYGDMFGNQDAIHLGIHQILEFLKYGMDKTTGLPYHGYDTKTHVKQGIIGWGRAVGWLMLAMADSLEYLPQGKERAEITEAFQSLTQAAFQYFRADGYFSWQLSAMEGPKDTSATAMIGYAVKKGISVLSDNDRVKELSAGSDNYKGNVGQKQRAFRCEKNISNEEMLKQIEKALLKSCKNGKIYDCSGECEGFSQYPQIYGAYPWSLGPGTRVLLME